MDLKRSIYKKIYNSKDGSIDWKWSEKGFNRIALVNKLVSKTGGLNCNYLEIGCDQNELFHSVASYNKIGVDPVSGGTHKMTSDDFFEINTKKFDVVFIDGLHEYQQVRRDALNSLKYLNDEGWIAFHDFLPANYLEQHMPRVGKGWPWTGDCWKLAYELSQAEGLEFKIVEIDRGVGLMRKISNDYSVPDLSESLLKSEFDKFLKILDKLPLCSFDEAIKLID